MVIMGLGLQYVLARAALSDNAQLRKAVAGDFRSGFYRYRSNFIHKDVLHRAPTSPIC